MTDSGDQQQILSGLRRLRVLRWSLFGTVVTFPLAVYLMTMFEFAEAHIITVGVAWVVSGIVLEFIIGFSRCPACRKYFHVRGMSGNFFTRTCMNCGVSLKGAGK